MLLQGALALVQFSRFEGLGMPALEAMACGTPVVASDIAPLVEVLGGAGVHVPLRIDALGRALERLLGRPRAARGARIARDRAVSGVFLAAFGRASPRAFTGKPLMKRAADADHDALWLGLVAAMARLSLLLFLGIALCSCVSKPKMELHHAEVRTAGPAGVGLEVFLRVNNENSFDVQVRNVRVQTFVQGRYALPPVAYSPNQWLPADSWTIVRAPAIIPWPLIGPLLAESAASSTISYRVRGEADVTAIRSLGIQSDNYPVDETGTIPRMLLLQAARSAMPF